MAHRRMTLWDISPMLLAMVFLCHRAKGQSCFVAQGTVSGTGVSDCYADRALREAQAQCNSYVNSQKNRYDVARACTTCPEGNGQSAWLIGQVSNYFDAGSWTMFGSTGRSCSFGAKYGCCVSAFNFNTQSSRSDDGLKLTNDPCGCTRTNTNPKTGATISCTCYFNNQQRARSCPGAMFGSSSGMWYRDC